MIAFLDGILVSGGTRAVVQVGGGMGLDVQVSALCAEQLPVPGEQVRLWTHLTVREDAWSLFGFVDGAEREVFRLLISVSGVGPKVALGMLSRVRPEDIVGYLRSGDEKALAGLPGIGKKSAARLVVELGQRVPQMTPGRGGTAADTGPLHQGVAVLGAMGLPSVQAEAALNRARESDPDVAQDIENWVRAALRVM